MGEIQKEIEEGRRDWEKTCMMVVIAPLIAGLMISNRVDSAIQEADPEVSRRDDWLPDEELVTQALGLYDELERQVTERLTTPTGEPHESRNPTRSEDG